MSETGDGIIKFSEVSKEIHESTLKKLQLFDSIRGKDVRELDIPFWDMVVVTAVDEQQRTAYKLQIDAKVSRGELPSGLIYEIVSDPNGTKIGNGGATLHAIEKLESIHGAELLGGSKILMLHAGGFSQRLPSASVLGKIFTAVPLGDPIYQMIEIKLALCIEFPRKMGPGVFISCPDIMELFTIEQGDWTFERPGITAIAHPSPIEIGTTHGVFVLDEKPHVDCSKQSDLPLTTLASCIEFLHKPSRERMHEKGAVFSLCNQDYVYTDSEFFMDWPTATKLVKLYRELSPLGCEIDAYGDFLQALGRDGHAEYCSNVANVVEVVPQLVETREKFFHVLRGTQFNVLLFNKSRFYHIGTMTEYLEAFCDNLVFRYEMCMENRVLLRCTGEEGKHPLVQPESTCVLHSIFQCPVHLGARCVVEYSYVESGVSIGDGSIVSNMLVPSATTIPSQCFFHTVCVTVSETAGLFVTVVFHIKDNLKKVKPMSELNTLNYCGQSMDRALENLKIAQEDLWPNNCTLTNLWHAKLFPVFTSQRASSLYATLMAEAVINDRPVKSDELQQFFTPDRLSMSEIVKVKDVKGTLKLREELRNKLLL